MMQWTGRNEQGVVHNEGMARFSELLTGWENSWYNLPNCPEKWRRDVDSVGNWVKANLTAENAIDSLVAEQQALRLISRSFQLDA